jgi:hypothetical protein
MASLLRIQTTVISVIMIFAITALSNLVNNRSLVSMADDFLSIIV